MPTNREIARLAGVSNSTVSLVRNDSPNVTGETRQRVLDAIRELEAREVHVKRSAMLADDSPETPESVEKSKSVLVLHSPILTNREYFRLLLEGIDRAADLHSVQLRFIPQHADPGLENITQIYLSNSSLQPDGAIIIGADLPDEVIEKYRALTIPCVAVGSPIPIKGISHVLPDDVEAAYKATHYLIDQGHRAIGYVSNETDTQYRRDRIEGFSLAHEENGLPISLAENSLCVEAVDEKLEDFLAANPHLTALVFGQNLAAEQGLPLLQQLGYTIPDDLSIIVIDDFDLPRTFEPPITTVAFPLIQEGQLALQLLIDLMDMPWLNEYRVICGTSLIERESCAPPGERA